MRRAGPPPSAPVRLVAPGRLSGSAGVAARLVVTVEDKGSGDGSAILAAADRGGALVGCLSTGSAVRRAVIPCAS
jgi:hypothetical protein